MDLTKPTVTVNDESRRIEATFFLDPAATTGPAILLSVSHFAKRGYVANAYGVNVEVEEYPTDDADVVQVIRSTRSTRYGGSLMESVRVLTVPAARHSAKALASAYVDALVALPGVLDANPALFGLARNA
jgi:hypothetical protein